MTPDPRPGIRRGPIEDRLITITGKLSEPELTAHEYFARLRVRIERFAADLDDRHDIFARLADFPDFRVLHVYHEEPYMIVFLGETNSGKEAEVIQHVNQMGLMLTKISCKRGKQKPIGFGPPVGD